MLRYHAEQPLVQGIWRAMAAQLAACTDCVNAYHAAQAGGLLALGCGHQWCLLWRQAGVV